MGVEAQPVVEIEFVVEPNYDGWRLDKYLCVKIRRLSRTRVQRIIERDLVGSLKASSLLRRGQVIKIRRRMLSEPDDIPPPSALGTLYSDDQLLVLDKPPGLPIHPTARYHHGTLVSQLKERGIEAFPAHRLDRETSGIVVCGRTLEASQRLMESFSGGHVKKQYLAIVEGSPPDTYFVDAPIAEGTELIRIAVRIDASGKPARTRFQVEKRFGAFALVRAFPETGRQHQIRIHSREAGFPLVGDKMYGPDPGYFDRFSKHCLEEEAWERLRLPRHALHAAAIAFEHPTSKKNVSFESPLPADLTGFVELSSRAS
ncbi:MAG: RluA family pseudouridine synthase [Myxococcaceae bacterium]|nr:RluA family pseudouridine synthase [Myxococcaceae bacterium]